MRVLLYYLTNIGRVKFTVDSVDSKVHSLFKMHQLSDIHMLLLCRANNLGKKGMSYLRRNV